VRAFGRTDTAADRLLLVGGAARSDVWGQLLADWLGLPIDRPSVPEAAARGAAIQAAHVVDGAPLHRPVATDASWEPHTGNGVAGVAAAYAGATPR
jgi:xylulokinase